MGNRSLIIIIGIVTKKGPKKTVLVNVLNVLNVLVSSGNSNVLFVN